MSPVPAVAATAEPFVSVTVTSSPEFTTEATVNPAKTVADTPLLDPEAKVNSSVSDPSLSVSITVLSETVAQANEAPAANALMSQDA